MKIRCQCGAIYNVPETTAGKNVKCKKCGVTFVCPTPPPKPNFGAATETAPKQNVPGTFATSPNARSKTAQRTDSEQDAILKKYMSEEKSLEDRMRERRESSIEEDRTANSIGYIFVGCIWIVVGVLIGIALWNAAGPVTNGRARGLLFFFWFIYGLGGHYWIPPLLGVIGVYKIIIGLMSMFRVVDIESEERLPSNW